MKNAKIIGLTAISLVLGSSIASADASCGTSTKESPRYSQAGCSNCANQSAEHSHCQKNAMRELPRCGGRTNENCSNCNENDQYQEALMNAYENKDYDAWKALMEERGGGKVLQIVDEDNFEKFAEAKILQSEGKTREAKAILEELGFPFMNRGMGQERTSPCTDCQNCSK